MTDDSVITPTQQSLDNEVAQDSPNWDMIPYTVIVEIFRNMPDADRIKMAQVCSKFHTSFRDPSLWRKRFFSFDGCSDEKNLYFSLIFGSCLRCVHIHCRHHFFRTCKNITQNLESFFSNIKYARLHDFSSDYLDMDASYITQKLMNRVTTCFIKLFQAQTELKKVKFQFSEFNVSSGQEVLNSVAESSGHKLEDLYLHRYFQTIRSVYEMEEFQPTLYKFTNLKTIRMSYSYISDGLLRHWAVSLRHKLEYMKLNVFKKELHSQIISNETWKVLSASCPKLKVCFDIDDLRHGREIISILKPAIPMMKLDVSLYYRNAVKSRQALCATDGRTFSIALQDKKYQILRLSVFLRHVADCFGDRLEKLRLNFEFLKNSVDNELIYILERCHKLQSFVVFGNIGNRVGSNICELLKVNDRLLREVLFVPDDEDDPEIKQTQAQIKVMLDKYKNGSARNDD